MVGIKVASAYTIKSEEVLACINFLEYNLINLARRYNPAKEIAEKPRYQVPMEASQS